MEVLVRTEGQAMNMGAYEPGKTDMDETAGGSGNGISRIRLEPGPAHAGRAGSILWISAPLVGILLALIVLLLWAMGLFQGISLRDIGVAVGDLMGASSREALVSEGRSLYNQHCVSCHGQQGGRIPAAPLDSRPFIEGLGPALTRSIAEGKGAMPAWGRGRGGPLDPRQVKAVAEFLRSSGGLAAQAAASGKELYIKSGSELFSKVCSPCHGTRGDRIPAAPLNSPQFLSRFDDSYLALVFSRGKGTMPAFGMDREGPLGEEEIRAVVSHLRTSAGQTPSPALATLSVGSAERGRELFAKNCLICHPQPGAMGDQVTPEKARQMVSTLTDEQIASLIQYIKSQIAVAAATHTARPSPTEIKAPQPVPHRSKEWQSRCLECHDRSAIAPMPVNHAGRTNALCLLCHEPGQPAPTVSHAIQDKDRACLTCHGKEGKRPVPTTHEGRKETICLTCHQQGDGTKVGIAGTGS